MLRSRLIEDLRQKDDFLNASLTEIDPQNAFQTSKNGFTLLHLAVYKVVLTWYPSIFFCYNKGYFIGRLQFSGNVVVKETRSELSWNS